MQVISVGEIIWDVFEDGNREFLGGAALNFSVNLRRLGIPVSLISAVGRDARGVKALEQIQMLGLGTELIQTASIPTGTANVSTNSMGSASFKISRPAAYDCLNGGESLWNCLRTLDPDWIYCGTMSLMTPHMEQLFLQIKSNASRAKVFYDLNLREGHWTMPLVERLSSVADVLKLNETEAEQLHHTLAPHSNKYDLEEFCRYWLTSYSLEIIAITLGDQGCAVLCGDDFHRYPGYRIEVADTVGAGDAFAAGLLFGLVENWPMDRIASFANGLGALVSKGEGAIPTWTLEECLELSRMGKL